MKYKIILISLLLLYSCSEDKFIEAEPQMVVEGWIDDGGHPIVMLSQIIPVSEKEIKYDELGDYVITWGKVTVSDGKNEVILTGMKSDDYYPPYIYTTNKIRGEAGKKYYLTAEYKNFYVTAETTIPIRAEVEKFTPSLEREKYKINAVIKDNPNENNYYKIFCKVSGRDSCYLSSNFAVIDDKNFTTPYTISIDIGHSQLYDPETNSHVISENDELFIKVAQIDRDAYNFWDDYKNIMELGQNTFFRYSSSIRSNVSGGLGYWIGYGATEYLLKPYNHGNPIRLNK